MSNITELKTRLPKPSDVGIDIPKILNVELFNAGFEHGMQSNLLTIFKRSYMEGFRAAKMYLKEVRRERGILQMPMKGRMSTKHLSDPDLT